MRPNILGAQLGCREHSGVHTPQVAMTIITPRSVIDRDAKRLADHSKGRGRLFTPSRPTLGVGHKS